MKDVDHYCVVRGLDNRSDTDIPGVVTLLYSRASTVLSDPTDCGFHVGMEECSEHQEAPPSTVQLQSHWNLNLHSDSPAVECSGSKVKDQEKSQSRPSSGSDSFLQESGDYQWLDDGYNRELNYSVEKHHQSVLAPFVEQNNFSYDDLSKHFDASLAELDMETFRTEDIPSMLAFPTIFSGNISRENCASVSGSVLGTLELDSSVSPRSTSEESAEMSICKDEPLFSPVKEQPLTGGNISVDSLDCSSLEEHDIVLTCQANKNNYTIVFESSGTQYTDDSDFLETADSSEGEGNQWFQHNHGQRRSQGCMIQSDLAFTTWGKLRRMKEATSYKCANKPTTSKSQSLPNLLRQSLVLKTKYLPVNPLNCVPLYDLQTSQPSHSKDSETSGSQHSVPLLQLYIRNRSSLGSEGCSISISSSQSESSGYMMTPPLYGSNSNMQGDTEKVSQSKGYIRRNSVKQCECKVRKERSGEIYRELEKSEERRMTMVHSLGSNFTTLPVDDVTEANNNLLQMSTNNNTYQTNICEQESDEEEESSQYFEDSLVEAPPPRPVVAHSSIIHEEEEPLDTDSGSGDETMKDSKEPIGSDSATSEEITLTKNNTIKIKPKVSKQDRGAGTVQRINNFFTTSKVDNFMANNSCESTPERFSVNWVDLTPEINSQGTQTKQLNSKRSGSMQEFFTESDKHLNNARPHSPRESSPASSGYGSSRQNSVERLRQNSQLFINNTNTITLNQSQRNKTVVTVPTLHDRVTQIPVHIKNRSVQTSFTNVSDGFMIEEATMMDKSTSSSFTGDNSTSPNISEDTEPEKKPVYVCFPNYSLPDLSFLKELTGNLDGPNLLYLKPSSPIVPPYMRDFGISQSEKNKVRSLSFPEFESISQDTFNHIQDWDSLSVLLPNDLKPLIPKLSQSKIEEKKHETEDNKKNNYPIFHNEPCWVFSKSIKKTSSSEENTGMTGKCFSSTNHNLPEPESPDIPPPLPKRSLSLLKDNCFGDGSSSSPKGILRKSPSSDYCLEQNHQQFISKCRNASCMSSKKEDLKNKRRSLHEPCQQLLENIPESSNVKRYCCFAPSTCHVVDQALTNVVCNSKEIPDTKSSIRNPLQKNLSEGCCTGCPNHGCQNCMPSKQSVCLCCHADSSNQLEGFQHNRFSFPRFATFEGKQPLQQLCGQLQQLLNSSTSLNLMAAALLAAQGSPEGSNASSTSSNCNCARSKKAVSFCEKVAVQSREMGTTAGERPCQQNNKIATVQPCGHKSGEAKDVDYKEEMDQPPEDFQVSPSRGQFPNFPDYESPLSVCDETSAKCLNQKADLVKNLAQAIDALVLDLSEGCDHKEQVLEGLCPALYAIVADGLLPTVKGLFGYVSNSPWRVAEASALSGEPPADLKELIRYVSGKENLVDNTCRFYAFILGLLNLGSLDWWFLHLTSCKTLVSRHYTSEALLSLLSFPSATSLCEELLTKLRPLASMSFTLELSVEYSVFVSEVQPSPQEHSTFHDTEEKNHVVRRRHAKMEHQSDANQRQRPVSFMEKGQLKTLSHQKRQSWNGSDLTEKRLLEVLSQESSNKQKCEDIVGKQISNKMREKPPLPEKPKTLVPSRVNRELGSEVMQKGVNVAFPSSKPTIQKSPGCSSGKGNKQGIKIQKNDVERPRSRSATEDVVSNTFVENKKDCDGKVFEQLKRRWENLTTTNNLETVKTNTVTTVTSKRPPIPATSLSKQKSEKVQSVVPKMFHAVSGRRKSHHSPVSSQSSVSSHSSTSSPVRSLAVGPVSPSPSPDSSSLVRRATSPNMLPSQVTPPVSPSSRGRGHVNRKSFIPVHRVARTSPSPQRRPRSTGSSIPRPGEDNYH
ncbi:uncharacterized protein LOC106465062 isoform X2 [Limulus polyphemus]|uniref:Uncharacterized protein LOC106465062 isoform X2 n=1 Tax=Limulus polyphemus TaxID=6850 RepID=A0ABM1BF36_LIMPO|nr:uncharacterized protein LOC106465062 isoform X2 [Limulus polyphemus]